jgi:hypothetical protein
VLPLGSRHAGNAPLPQTRSYAQCYGGHQFGHWAGAPGALLLLVCPLRLLPNWWHSLGCLLAAWHARACLPACPAGQLGDGRAICLGQSVNAEGERWELQLKVGLGNC